MDYDKLPDFWTIWILPYDPFGKDRIIYFVKNIIEGFDEIVYNDGIRKVFLYTDGHQGGNDELRNLLQYIKNSEQGNAADTELKQLHSNVERLKRDNGIGVKYMQMQEIIKYTEKKAREEGRQEGIDKGVYTLVEALGEMGCAESIIVKKLIEKYDMSEEMAKEYIKG